MTARPGPHAAAAAAANAFNLAHPVGARVIWQNDDGACLTTRTRTPAAVIGGETPVIWLDGIAGWKCVPLARVTPIGAYAARAP